MCVCMCLCVCVFWGFVLYMWKETLCIKKLDVSFINGIYVKQLMTSMKISFYCMPALVPL